MAEGIDNLVLEQLRLMREDMQRIEGKLSDQIDGLEKKIDDLAVRVDGHTAILVGLGKYIHDIDERVESIEDKLGGTT